jgi:hypothetical protein
MMNDQLKREQPRQ